VSRTGANGPAGKTDAVIGKAEACTQEQWHPPAPACQQGTASSSTSTGDASAIALAVAIIGEDWVKPSVMQSDANMPFVITTSASSQTTAWKR
jgi:hypothetical protein